MIQISIYKSDRLIFYPFWNKNQHLAIPITESVMNINKAGVKAFIAL